MTTPQANFNEWLNLYYDKVDSPFGPYLRCVRCRKRVGYVTKHAAVRHGDNIKVMPPVNLAMVNAY